MIQKGAGRSLHATPKTLQCIMHCSLENKMQQERGQF
jgi:hypothetical protein